MTIDRDDKTERDSQAPNYDGVADDARSAYEEVAARISDAAETSSTGARAAKGGDDTPEKASADQHDGNRDSRGRFAPKGEKGGKPETAENAEPVNARTDRANVPADKASQEAKPSADREPEAQTSAPVGGPPPSFSIKTKAEWDKLPEHVRADIVKREQEMGQGLQALRDYKDLKPYAEIAARHNTTIPRALDHFMRIENLLKQDLGAGVSHIVQQSGMNQAQAAQFFGQLAQKFGGAAGPSPGGTLGTSQDAGGQPDPLLDALRPVLGPLQQQIAELKGHVTSRAEADRNAQMQSLGKAIESFSADPANRFFPELEQDIVKLFNSGMVTRTGNDLADLKTAYDMAARLNAEVNDALIEQRIQAKQEQQRKAEHDAAQKARSASRSLSGSRIPGSTTRQVEEAASTDDVEADVIRAYRQLTQA